MSSAKAICAVVAVLLVFVTAAAFATRICPACGAANPDENNFCEQCGTPLLKSKTLTVITDPSAAVIYVNGLERGKGRVTITLEPGGSATVAAMLKGYDVDGRTVTYETATPITLKLTKHSPPPKTAKPKGFSGHRSFWDSDVLLWGTVGLTAACFGYGYYNEREAADAARSGSESTDPWEIEFYRTEVDKYERRRNASYIAGGGVACGAAYFGARRVFFALNPVKAGFSISIGF